MLVGGYKGEGLARFGQGLNYEGYQSAGGIRHQSRDVMVVGKGPYCG